MRIYAALIVVVLMCVSGCASPESHGPEFNARASGLVLMRQGALPPPLQGETVGGIQPYRIGPFDKLAIDVFGIEELSEKQVQADAGGNISFPLAGSVEAGGKTPLELAAILEEKLRQHHVRNPQVTVNLQEMVSRVFTVDGQVREPGSYPIANHMTLIRAIATAKGATEYAKLKNVVILRTVEGKRLAGVYDLGAIRRGTYDDPDIYPDDIVLVGDNAARRLFRDALQLLPAITTPLVYLLAQN